VLQSEQQAIKSINKTQLKFEASAETIYFIQNEIEKDDE
jgi:cell division protein FtsB